MTMQVIVRPALDADMSAVENILRPWIREDPTLGELVATVAAKGAAGPVRCRVLEYDHTVRCVSLWLAESPVHIRLLAVGLDPEASASGYDVRFLHEEIMDWAEMGVSKVTIRVPEKLAGIFVPSLRNCGFMYEGICSSCCEEPAPWITFCKHFLYRTITDAEVLGFLQDFLVSLGYEVRAEGEGFTYRLRSEFRLPFIFSSWHRVTKSGGDLVVQPPARVLEWSELETLFYPFRVQAEAEKPLLLPMERKTADGLIDMPATNNHQSSLFEQNQVMRTISFNPNNVAYVDPTGIQGVRKGLPLMFYLNRVGAVGTARVDDWMLEDARAMQQRLLDRGWLRDGQIALPEGPSWAKSGKLLAVRFHWYRPLKRPVRLEEIRALDRTFSPQRVRCLTADVFHAIVAAAGKPQPG
jgi:hypothetical protein